VRQTVPHGVFGQKGRGSFRHASGRLCSPYSRAYRPNGRELLTRYVPALSRRGPPRVSVQQKLDVPRPLLAESTRNTSAAALNSLPLLIVSRFRSSVDAEETLSDPCRVDVIPIICQS